MVPRQFSANNLHCCGGWALLTFARAFATSIITIDGQLCTEEMPPPTIISPPNMFRPNHVLIERRPVEFINNLAIQLKAGNNTLIM